MPVLQIIFFVTTFSCAATQLVFHEHWHPFVRPQLASESPCYVKPTGTCDAEGHGCSSDCSGGRACPPYPQKSPKCMELGTVSTCGIQCSSDKDCPEKAYCQNFGESYPSMCMYKQ
ncbi:hypothetical protein FOL47_010732 [Perkinsus chesapeaki]|uniref:Uncharacterized protein n=1 Tax=Perkinsus chesapeaki TaxID=330153 RepID=A0A7J6L1J0_PERCH|nr:hypothetical protein FOL47_010732 [Perkinsus chesapeaki]